MFGFYQAEVISGPEKWLRDFSHAPGLTAFWPLHTSADSNIWDKDFIKESHLVKHWICLRDRI